MTRSAHGSVVNNGTSITYRSKRNFTGQDTFTYTASDGEFTDTAIVTVNVSPLNQPPSANAGADQTMPVAATVQLNGAGSTDPDGDTLTFQWSFQSRPAGSAAVLSNPTAVDPTFAIDQFGIYVVQLVVNDGQVDSTPDT